jgi:hypothetical protein
LLNRLSSLVVSSWNRLEVAMALLRTVDGSNRGPELLLAAADVPRLNKQDRQKSNKRRGYSQGQKSLNLLSHCDGRRLFEEQMQKQYLDPRHIK